MKKLIYRLEVRYDEKTHMLLEAQATKYKRTKSEFIRNLINKRASNKRLKNIELIGNFNAKVLLDISRVTGNINQIAYKLNLDSNNFDEKNFYEVTSELKMLIREHTAELKKTNLALKEIY